MNRIKMHHIEVASQGANNGAEIFTRKLSGSDALQASAAVKLTNRELLPIVDYLAFNKAGEPELFGSKCGRCGELTLGAQPACQCCGDRSEKHHVVLSSRGTLYNYTVVHRSLPGVSVPFVFAIVDLDGGGVIKGNLNAPADQVAFDMPVRVVFEEAPRRDTQGRAYLSYHFMPA